MFKLILLVVFLISSNGFCSSHKKPKDPVIPTAKDFDKQIQRKPEDKQIDQLIKSTLGEDFRRTNVYDQFPLEIKQRKLSTKQKSELLDYYDYARRNLEYLSQSKLLKAFNLDFDLDLIKDLAVIVSNDKESKIYLAIFNQQKKLYLEPFLATHLEQYNQGRYPLRLVYEEDKQIEVKSPCLRLVDFDETHSQALFYDQNWQAYNLVK